MKSLDEHNAERQRDHEATRRLMEPHPNGIACPKCGAESWDSCPMMVLTSVPAQKNVHCPACGWHGYALL